MFYSTPLASRNVSTILAGAFLALCQSHAFAGAQANADTEITQQQVAVDHAFPVHFSLSLGGDSEFVFRGVDILPEVDINITKALTEALKARPADAPNSLANFQKIFPGQSPKQIAADLLPKSKRGAPVEVSHESGMYYTEGTASAYNFTLGAFYATQAESRPSRDGFSPKPIFDVYREFDAYLQYKHAFGPVTVATGGTFYHVINNSNFDTAEFNVGVFYTPPKFPYVVASFSYDYDSAFNYSDYHQVVNIVDNASINGKYLDGHYLEARLEGNIPPFKNVVGFTPYVLVSAGSGILPRAFNAIRLPTYSNTERYGKSLTNASGSAGAFDPATLDRSFDLSNFQAGFRVPIYLTRYISVRGDFNYSRPLGNLDREPYNQHDEIWGGGSITVAF